MDWISFGFGWLAGATTGWLLYRRIHGSIVSSALALVTVVSRDTKTEDELCQRIEEHLKRRIRRH